MSINFWDLLHQRQDELTKSGRAVADYLLQHADEAQYLSISSLAKECNVAEATVFRFCRALGFEGYHEMRIALAQANATGSMVNHQELQPGATTATLCDHAHALFMTAINGTQNALSTEAVDEIDRIAESTDFNGIKLLNGDLAANTVKLSGIDLGTGNASTTEAASKAVSTQVIGAGAAAAAGAFPVIPERTCFTISSIFTLFISILIFPPD